MRFTLAPKRAASPDVALHIGLIWIVVIAGCAAQPGTRMRHEAINVGSTATPTNEEVTKDPERFLGHQVTLYGAAGFIENFGLAFVTANGNRFYVSGLEGWPEGVKGGAVVRVSGLLARRKLFGDPTVDPLGRVTGAGMWGAQFVLDHPTWTCQEPVALKPKLYELGKEPKYYEWEAMQGHRVSIEGYLSRERGEPVLDLMRNGMYYVYVPGFEFPESMQGKPVRAVGTVEVRFDAPRPGLDARGRVLVAASYAPRYLLKDAEFTELPVAK